MVSEKLEQLTKLQKIDSKIDSIKKVRGALPDEVRDLEDEIAKYDTRLHNFDEEIVSFENDIDAKKTGIKTSEGLIKKYEEQQMNVRNNREYDAITKEMELQTLEIQVSEKRIKEAYIRIDEKKEEVGGTKSKAKERAGDLKAKKEELDTLLSESEADEAKLLKERNRAGKVIEDRLLLAYDKLRGNARNGLAVVNVKRSACGGCFNVVPHQRQADIKEKKKIIVCEHCGRILSGVDIEPIVEKPKAKRTVRKKATTTKAATATAKAATTTEAATATTKAVAKTTTTKAAATKTTKTKAAAAAKEKKAAK
jgi:predicted  nucleic acid-binding Zn-ribbon protein